MATYHHLSKGKEDHSASLHVHDPMLVTAAVFW